MNAAKTIDDLISESGLSVRKAAERVGVHHTTLGRWRHKDVLSEEQKQKISDAFDVGPDEVVGEEEGEPGPGWVQSRDQVERWRDKVVASQPDQWELIALMALPSFLDEETWVVSVTPKAIADHMGEKYGVSQFEEVWSDLLDSDLVEAVGSGEWTLKLVVPEG